MTCEPDNLVGVSAFKKIIDLRTTAVLKVLVHGQIIQNPGDGTRRGVMT